MRPVFALLFCAGLAACASPEDQCRLDATKDLRVVNDLIEESEATLARGYALEESPQVRISTGFCLRPSDNFGVCSAVRDESRPRPVSVDLDEEARKLESLKKKRDELRRAAEPRIVACLAALPQSQ